MTVEQVLHHPYVTDNDTIDPFALHALDALPLPRTNSGPGGGDSGGKNEDKEWARRQCSIVWAPMPMSYDLSSTAGRGKVRPVDPLAPLLCSESVHPGNVRDTGQRSRRRHFRNRNRIWIQVLAIQSKDTDCHLETWGPDQGHRQQQIGWYIK
jgi:hypothetical protein